MTFHPAEPIPCLSETVEPPVVAGTAALSTAAAYGAGFEVLSSLVGQQDKEAAARLYDMAIVYQLSFRRAEGLGLQDDALSSSRLFRVRRENTAPADLRLLALMAPGDLMTNTPLDFITNHLNVRLDLLFLPPDKALPTMIPDHDAMFFAVGEADDTTLARLRRLFRAWPRPVLNDPGLLPALERDTLAGSLAGAPGLCSPPAVAVSRATLDGLADSGGDIAGILPGCSYPVLIRPFGSHAGAGLRKIDDPAALASYMMFSVAASYYVTAFVDYRSADGLFRKYRVAFIDRQPYLCHMAVSRNWMVHYLNAGMTESPEKRADEAQAMARFDAAFAARHRRAFAALHERLPFDYYSIDCGELPDGRLVVFEADSAAIIHLMDPEDLFPYKHPHMRRVFDAFGDMLKRRAAVAAGPRVN